MWKKTFKGLLSCILAACFHLIGNAQEFGSCFCDSTLRIDCIFAGNANEQRIYIDKLSTMPKWYGRKVRLDSLPVEGNGQITVRSHKTGEVVYRNSFSTLFQEWLSYDEAKSASKSFENVLLIPMPKDTIDITIDLRNQRREIASTLTQTINPKDVLIRHIGNTHTPYEVINAAADTTKCIHIAFLAEGYTSEEMNVYLRDVRTATDAIFAHEPFKTYKDRFNIIAVKSVSQESGTSEPAKGIWKNTAVGSHFDTFYSSRYLTTLQLKQVHDLLAGTPYEHIIILVNTAQYGGGGILNLYNLCMTHHSAFRPVIVHEFGHSFAGLADEYAYDNEAIPMYPHDIEPWEKNITTLTDFGSKWKSLIQKNTPVPTPESKFPSTINTRIGVFEGAGYSTKGVYRAMQDCRMRTNTHPEFCTVCNNALSELIRFYTE